MWDLAVEFLSDAPWSQGIWIYAVRTPSKWVARMIIGGISRKRDKKDWTSFIWSLSIRQSSTVWRHSTRISSSLLVKFYCYLSEIEFERREKGAWRRVPFGPAEAHIDIDGFHLLDGQRRAKKLSTRRQNRNLQAPHSLRRLPVQWQIVLKAFA